jgi:hypothetical protein
LRDAGDGFARQQRTHGAAPTAVTKIKVAVTNTAAGTPELVVLASLPRVPVSGELHSTRERGKDPITQAQLSTPCPAARKHSSRYTSRTRTHGEGDPPRGSGALVDHRLHESQRGPTAVTLGAAVASEVGKRPAGLHNPPRMSPRRPVFDHSRGRGMLRLVGYWVVFRPVFGRKGASSSLVTARSRDRVAVS